MALPEEPGNLLALGLLGRASEALSDSSATEEAARRFLAIYPEGESSIEDRNRGDLDRYLAWARNTVDDGDRR